MKVVSNTHQISPEASNEESSNILSLIVERVADVAGFLLSLFSIALNHSQAEDGTKSIADQGYFENSDESDPLYSFTRLDSQYDIYSDVFEDNKH